MKQKLKNILPKSEFARNVLTLMTGTTVAQAVPIAISPVLTRVYGPEDFGLLALYTSILMVFSSLVAGRYELSILIPKNENHAKHLVVSSLAISFFVCCILFTIIVLFADKITSLLANRDIYSWLYVLPLNIFITSAISILYFWENRKKQYKVLSSSQVLQSTSQAVTNLSLGYFFKYNAGLICGLLFGNLLSFFYLLKKTSKDFRLNMFKKNKAIVLLKKYNKFPKFMLPSGLLENLSGQLPVFLLGVFFSQTIVGFFALSQRIVRVPVMFIGSAVGNVFRQEASEHFALNGECRGVFISTFKKLLIISVIPFIIFGLIAPYLFAFIFGEQWKIAGEYAQILTPLFLLQFIVSPLSSMFMIAEKQEYDLYIQIYLILSVSLALVLGGYFDSVRLSLVAFCFVYSMKYLFELYKSFKFSCGIDK